MTIRAKWLGQDCTVINCTDYASTPMFLVAALPGQAFFDGSTMFSAYQSEIHDLCTCNEARFPVCQFCQERLDKELAEREAQAAQEQSAYNEFVTLARAEYDRVMGY